MYGAGKASINVKELTAGSSSAWTIVYIVGEYGIDDSGEILISRRDVSDADIPQFDNPDKTGYVKVTANVDAKLIVKYEPDKYVRPWRSCISIRVSDGSLCPGDKITISFGNGTKVGSGYRVQTFAEKEYIFKILVDCAGSGEYYEIDESPVVEIVGGYASQLHVVTPPFVLQDQPFTILVRAIDSWGNIAGRYNTDVIVNVFGKDHIVTLKKGIGFLEGITLNRCGTFYLNAKDIDGAFSCVSNPVKCEKTAELQLYCGDMHGQTKETVGTGTLDLYFSFARDAAGLDFCAWQGNDFQITDETWQNVCNKIKQYHDPGKFITFLGYEWSGTTPVGGDYNIYFLNDDQKIHRSYHWQIDMNKRDGSERNPINELFREFKGRTDVMAIPHVGGRHGNLDLCDTTLCSVLEIHSHHGTFEWFYDDAIKKGLKLGIIAASDDHTCRPGLSYPTRKTSRGFVSFDVIGGYTFIYAKELSRLSIWDAYKSRHTYGTTGERIILNFTCKDKMMGDEFSLNTDPEMNVEVAGTNLISEIEVKRGLDTVFRYSDSLKKKKNTIRIFWSGVRSKARGKRTIWDGRLTIQEGSFLNVTPLAFNQPDEGVTKMSNQLIEWISSTSGDIDGIEVEFTNPETAILTFSSKNVNFDFSIKDLNEGRIVKEAGWVNQKVEVMAAREETQKETNFCFTDKNPPKGIQPYYIKVTQKDGHMAWCSPMFINIK